MKEWFEDDAFWKESYSCMFPLKKFENAENECRNILRLTRRRKGSILDLCCGPGRHSVALAKRGFRVTGVDRTAFLLKKARGLASEIKAKVEWIREDMRNFRRPETFDLVLNLSTSFGYFDKNEEDLQVLKNIFDSLKPNGTFFIDVMSKECLARNFQPTTSFTMNDGTILLKRHEIFADWTRIRNEWLFIRKEKIRSFRFHHTIYSGQELKDRMHQAGFKKVQLFGDMEGNPYGFNAQRLIAVGWK